MGTRLLLDTFHRPDASEWGTADSGNVWTPDLTSPAGPYIAGCLGAGDPTGETGVVTDVGTPSVILCARIAQAGIYQGFFFGAHGDGDDDNVFVYQGSGTEFPNSLIVAHTKDGDVNNICYVPYVFSEGDRWTITVDKESGTITVEVNDETRIQLSGLDFSEHGSWIGYYDGDDSGRIDEIEVYALYE